jgi:hypothetical protein
MLKETIDAAKRAEVVTEAQLAGVNIDTTVQEKAIKYPTDGALVDTVRRTLVRIALAEGIASALGARGANAPRAPRRMRRQSVKPGGEPFGSVTDSSEP